MIEIIHLSFAYSAKDPKIFSDFNLTIGTGERIGFVGKSGAGKSTLCKLLASYLQVKQGEILIDGQKYRRGYNPVQLIFQHPEFAFNPNITLGISLKEVFPDKDEYLPYFKQFLLKPDMLKRYPHELSGGELQRMAILRILKPETQYIVADELSAMLDSYTQALIWSVIQNYLDRTGAGIIMVAHDETLLNRIVHRKIRLDGS
jgi:peptide/nickel transport system ATP-binding protein